MGIQNDMICSYLDEDCRFADLFNGSFFQGERVIRPEDLKEASEVYVGKERDSGSSYQRIRDIKKLVNNGMMLRILAIEGQTHVDYAMPWRCLNYDDLEYGRQMKRIRKKNGDSGVYDSTAERLCGVKKTDRLVPAYTICLYYGEEPWDGPRSLKDMMDFGHGSRVWENRFADYPMNLICVNELTDFACFQTPLRELFTIMRYRRDKKGLKALLKEDPAYQEMDEETAQVIGVLMGVDKFMEKRDKYRKEDKYNMCQALEEMMEDSKQEGINEERRKAIGRMLKKLSIDEVVELGYDRTEVSKVKEETIYQ